MKATAKLPRHGDHQRAEPVDVPLPPLSPDGASTYGQAALDQELAALIETPQGERNDRLNVAGFNLAQLVAAGHLVELSTRDWLYTTGVGIGLTQSETLGTIRSSFDAGMKLPRQVPETNGVAHDAPDATEWTPPPDPAQETDEEPTPPTIDDQLPDVDWTTFWDAESREEWLVEPLIPARRLVALFSPAKVGKSLLMLELAVQVARGAPVIGQRMDRPRSVLYVDFENDLIGDLRPRMEAMGLGPDDDLSNLHYLSFPALPFLDTAMGGLMLTTKAASVGAELVVIDTISRAVAGEENDNDTWLNFYRHTGVKLKAAGVACVRLDHTGKDLSKGMRGGSAKAGDVDAAWFLSKLSDNVLGLECVANRLPITHRYLTLTRLTTPRLHTTVEHGHPGVSPKVAEVVEWLVDLDWPTEGDGSGRDQACDKAKGLGLHPGKWSQEDIRLGLAEYKTRAVEIPDDDHVWTPGRGYS